MSSANTPQLGKIEVTEGHPVHPDGVITVHIDFGNGVHMKLNWNQWLDWQGERLNEMVNRMDTLRDLGTGLEH